MKNNIKKSLYNTKIACSKNEVDKDKLKITFSADLLLYLIFALGMGDVAEAFAYASAIALHESIHYYCAQRRGYKCRMMNFSAFGAVLYGDFEVMNKKDEIAVALSAPIANIALALVCAAFWWLLPESYLFTAELAEANAAMGLFNLIPCYPLDGGRVVSAFVRDKKGIKYSLKLIRMINYSLALIFAVIFTVNMLKGVVDFNIISFIFLVVFNASASKPPATAVYTKRTFHELLFSRGSRGICVERTAFDGSVLLFEAYRSCSFGKLWLVDVFHGDTCVSTLNVLELENAVFSLRAGATLADAVRFCNKVRKSHYQSAFEGKFN